MTDQTEARPGWRRYAAEALTIVVGILLALAADAGRQYFADRASEREILTALRVEFAADVTELETDQAHRTQKLASIDLLNRVRAGKDKSPPPDALAGAMLDLLDWRFYTASHPVLDDLVTTGRLDLIQSDELRHMLMVFGQERSRIGVTEQYEREFVASYIAPYLATRLDLEALSSDSPARVAAAVLPANEVLADKSFGSLLYLSRDRTQGSRNFGQTLLTAVSNVQRVLAKHD